MQERDTYYMIKEIFLGNLFDLCKDFNQLKSTNDYNYSTFISIIDDDFLYTYESSIEKLMFKVVCLIMTGGWDESLVKYFTNEIALILSEFSLDQLLIDIPKEEASDFIEDLKAVNLMSYK